MVRPHRKASRPGAADRRRRTALKLIAEGRTVREIAESLDVSERAVRRLLSGLGVRVV